MAFCWWGAFCVNALTHSEGALSRGGQCHGGRGGRVYMLLTPPPQHVGSEQAGCHIDDQTACRRLSAGCHRPIVH
jgi:hypothetical protein